LPGRKTSAMSWKWNPSRETAAALYAADRLTNVQIAKRAGVSERTLRYWLQIPAFVAHVLELREILRRKAWEEALQFGIADIRERVRGLNEDREKLLQIIAERGKDPIMEGVPGGGTGHLIHQKRAIGQGNNNEIIDEFVFDAVLYHALRETEKQAAMELGQWIEMRQEVTPPPPPIVMALAELLSPE
jgi:DNA-binding transcriptional MerR regulator